MSELVSVDIRVRPETAAALKDTRRLDAIGRLVDMMVHGAADDPLIAVMHAMSAEARAAGLTEEDIEEELASWRDQRRLGRLPTETLRDMVQAGIDSGPDVEAGPVFDALIRKYSG